MIDALWWFMGTELVGTVMCGPAFLSAPLRIPTYFNKRLRGYERHKFRPHIRKDIGTALNSCDVCWAKKGNWIHFRDDEGEIKVYDPEEEAILRDNKIRSLEAQSVRWRFAHDPDWVKIFGDDYDLETGNPIPQFHNGECGGPNDSCERCNWEADQAEKEAEEKAKAQEKKRAAKKQEVSKLDHEEIEAYEDILWTLWNTVHDYKFAKEEWEELLDEIGMLKNDKVRRAVKQTVPFLRINYIMVNFDNPETAWRRREEKWQGKVTKEADYARLNRHKSYSDVYDDYKGWY